MMRAVWLMCVCVVAGSASGETRYGFYREMYGGRGAREDEGEGRRVFGGEAAREDAWPAACLLRDRYWAARCSGSVLAARWALTAAHCVSPRLAYVEYNTNRGASGQHTPVHYLYRHPGYKVKQEDLGRGMDVTLLHHDVGLVRTHGEMRLRAEPPVPLLRSMATYTLKELNGEIVQVLGFGRTEKLAQGERLVSARLRVVRCERSAWLHCVCGAASAGGGAAGVCSGDSGGPVVYRGSQVAVTSMGPLACAAGASAGGPRAEDAPTSVFTALHEYAPLINATIDDTEDALRMTRIPTAAARALRPPLALLAATAPLSALI